MAETARISPRSDEIIKEMAKVTGKSKVEIIEFALETYRRNERLRLLNKAYRNLKAKPESWKEELKEREELEGVIGDGLEEN